MCGGSSSPNIPSSHAARTGRRFPNLHVLYPEYSPVFLISMLAVNHMEVGSFHWESSVSGLLCLILGPADGTQEFLFAQPVAALLPYITKLLQGRTNLLARGDSQATQVMATDRETGNGPAAQFSQELSLSLVLQ